MEQQETEEKENNRALANGKQCHYKLEARKHNSSWQNLKTQNIQVKHKQYNPKGPSTLL